MDLLWYIPNQVTPRHRSDTTVSGHNSLDRLTALARLAEDHGWGGALIGTGWKRPDTFTVATALAACTTTFTPLIAIRPGYWTPAHFASSAATLDQLTGGRVKVNIVSGPDHQPQYGDDEGDQAARYARTREFMRLVRRLWTEDDVTVAGRRVAVGQQRLLDRAGQGEVHDDCLYTAPGRVGGGGAGTTWLVGSPDDVAKALRRYADLGVTHFVLSDTPYEQEIARIGDSLLPLLRSA